MNRHWYAQCKAFFFCMYMLSAYCLVDFLLYILTPPVGRLHPTSLYSPVRHNTMPVPNLLYDIYNEWCVYCIVLRAPSSICAALIHKLMLYAFIPRRRQYIYNLTLST